MPRLEACLDEWSARAASGAPPAALEREARALLATAAARLADGPAPAPLWHRFLDTTRRCGYLQALGSAEARQRWAEAAFAAVRVSRCSLSTLLAQRVAEHPGRALFVESPGEGAPCWSYESVARRLERTAAVFLRAARGRPRVAILSANSVDSACADLACLVHGIPVSPVNPETELDGLGWILERLKFNVVVVQNEEQRQRLERAGLSGARVFLLDPHAPLRGATDARLAEAVAQLAPAQMERALAAHQPPALDAPATVMFTSGSTGLPKGVVHTGHALVTKRFARAAALPAVGVDETLLCYLPLFHTFGRYLEMLGMLFWGGTYVFAGNPSFETLARALPLVRPTGLIGIPRRWAQLRERCLARPQDGEAALRQVAGDRLRWGLSAAGHLDPAVFRFFQRHGVELCSGFGMTEATGGITMTPPGQYEDGSVGLPLPGIRARLTSTGELEIGGPYVGSYLEDAEPAPGEERWLATGDVFVRRPSGHFEIVDRVKDVYKNTRGQTVAPAAVERRLADVPGVRRAFLVGDGRDHNALLIVPDREDPVIAGAAPEAQDAYFRQIVAAVNRDVAPPERVVSFALLDRDFDPERELTAKGTFRRKEIERAFAPVIESLYRADAVLIPCGPLRVRLPRWLHRDLGLLEQDLVAHEAGLLDRRSGRVLALAPLAAGRVRVGDLAYRVDGEVVDLGLFARQPLLWAGNPALRAFAPCKDGWDVPLARVGPQVVAVASECGRRDHPPPATAVNEPGLEDAHAVAARALLGRGAEALAAVEWIAGLLPHAEPRLGRLLRRRLEALAWHAELEVRCLAYRTLLLDEPLLGYGDLLASFVHAGRPFLTAESIEAIARAQPERYRLEALRERLRRYRRDLAWPATPEVRAVFEGILDLLDGAARARPEHLVPVRAELAAWALFEAEPALAASARARLGALAEWCRARVPAAAGAVAIRGPISSQENAALAAALADPSFLSQSVALAFDEADTRALAVSAEGVWVSRLPSSQRHRLFRVSFETVDAHHRDLLLALRDVGDPLVEETALWMIALGDRPGEDGVVPRFGCARPDLGVLSTAYVSCLSLWERVRAWAGEVGEVRTPEAWRSLFVRGLGAFFAGWRASDGRIVPGNVVPTNVAVPRADYLAGVRVLSLAGWRPYEGPRSLVEPMQRYFLEQAVGHYPALRGRLEPAWVYDAAVEGLGLEAARAFLADLAAQEGAPPGGRDALAAFRQGLESAYYEPLALRGAIDRYAEWQRSNPRATPAARRQLASQMHGLYGLEAHGELARYHLYRRTYFARAAAPVAELYDRLLLRLFERRSEPATRLVELSELQSALAAPEDRRALGELVFPRSQALQDAELRATPGASRVLLLSHVTDGRGARFAVREPVGAAEVGRLYRLLSESGLAAGSGSRQLVLLDAEERVVGGITWRAAAPRVAHIEGIVVAPGLRSQRLAGPLLEDFCARRASAGDVAVHTHFGPGPFPFAPGFGVDRRWGGLVRFLAPAAAADAEKPAPLTS